MVKRYMFFGNFDESKSEEYEFGDWVIHDDYAALESQLAATKAELDALREQVRWRPIAEAPKDGAAILAAYERQSGVPMKLVRFNQIHNYWESYGEPLLGFERNATSFIIPSHPTTQAKD